MFSVPATQWLHSCVEPVICVLFRPKYKAVYSSHAQTCGWLIRVKKWQNNSSDLLMNTNIKCAWNGCPASLSWIAFCIMKPFNWNWSGLFTEFPLYIYCHVFNRTKMNAPPPVVVTSPGVQQGMTSQPQVVVIQAPSSSPLEMGSSQRGCVVGMGATQVTIGILCFIFQIGAFIVPTSFSRYAAPGIWGPIFVSINSLIHLNLNKILDT